MAWLADPAMATESVSEPLTRALPDPPPLATTFATASWLGEARILLGGAFVILGLAGTGLAVGPSLMVWPPVPEMSTESVAEALGRAATETLTLFTAWMEATWLGLD